MNTKAIILFLILMIGFNCAAQNSNAIYYSNLNYNTNFEKSVFNNIENDSLNYIALFLAIDYNQDKIKNQNIEKRIAILYNSINKQNTKGMSVKKLANKIYKDVHKQLLTRYKAVCNISEMFEQGYYNCVTSTAIIAILFEKFEIPYTIKETPNHVYIIVDPEGENILIETTLPKNGYISVEEKVKKEYIEYLNENKILTQNEINQYSTDELFNKYYYVDKNIGLKELAGLNYFNEALTAMESQDFQKALFQLEKAQYLYQNERNLFLMNLCLVNLIENNNLNLSANYLMRFANYNHNEAYYDYVITAFEKLSHRYVIEKSDTLNYNLFYHSMKDGLLNDELVEKTKFIYHHYLGNFYLLQRKYTEAIDNLTVAYFINTKNLAVRSSILESVGRYLYDRRDYEKALDSLDNFKLKFPFLYEDERIQQFYIACCMKLTGDNYELNDRVKAEKYLTKFEELINDFENLEPDGDIIGYGFGQAFAYYVRKQKYSTAKTYINRGLKYAPYSTELKRKLKTLDEYLKN